MTPGVPLARVVAVIAETASGGPVAFGTGYLLDANRVLTARHCVFDRETGLPAASLRVVRASDGATVRVVLGAATEADLDIALLLVPAARPPWGTNLPGGSARFGRLSDREHSGELHGCEAIGFPRWQETGEFRDSAEVHGVIRVTDGRERQLLVLRDPVLSGVMAAGGGSVWAGFSGAAVFQGGLLLGVIIEHHPRQGDTSLQIRPIDAVAKSSDTAARQLAKALELDRDDAFAAVMAGPGRWRAETAGETALAQWGWSLERDPEGVRHWRPRARGVGIDSERGWRFRGRKKALDRIVSRLGAIEPDRRVLVITGSPGAGKSAVLGRIITTADGAVQAGLPSEDTSVRAPAGSVHCAVHAKGKTALEVAAEIVRAASGRNPGRATIPGQIEDFAPSLQSVFQGPDSTSGPFNVIIDALDEAATPEQARAMVRDVILPLAETFADEGVRVMVGTRRADGEGDLLASFGNAALLADLDSPDYFAREDLAAYVLATLQMVGNERSGNPYSDDAVAGPVADRIADLSERNFLIAGLTARNHGMHDTAAPDPGTLSFAPTVEDALREYLKRVRIPAAATTVAPGVAAMTLLTALAFAEEPGLPAPLWRTALRALGAGDVPEAVLTEFARSSAATFLVESFGDDGEHVSFRLFHQALGDALLTARARIFARADDEKALASAFLQAGRDSGWEHAPAYLLRSMSAHSARAKMMDELLADDALMLHSDLRRLIPLADDATSAKGRRRGRLLRFTPRALDAGPAERAALFSVTEALDDLGTSFGSGRWQAPYRALWATVQPRLGHTYLHGHDGRVTAFCEVSIDGITLAATAGYDHTVRIWNPRTGEQVKVLKGHEATVNTLCVVTCCDDAQLASGSDDGRVKLWNLRASRSRDAEVRTLSATGISRGRAHPDWIKAVCEVDVGNQRMLADAGVSRLVRLWNPRNGDLIEIINAGDLPVWSMCEVPTSRGSLLATGSGDQTVRLWDPQTAELVHSMKIDYLYGRAGVERSVSTLCMTVFGGRAVLAAGGPSVKLFDPEIGEQVGTLKSRHGRAIDFLCEIDVGDRRMLVGSGWSGTNAPQASDVQLWDVADLNRLHPREVQLDVELMGSIRAGNRTFFACRTFDAVALRDAREIFKETLDHPKD